MVLNIDIMASLSFLFLLLIGELMDFINFVKDVDALEFTNPKEDLHLEFKTASWKLPYRYDWVWQKTRPVGFLWSHHMPLRGHENIYVFYKHLPTYNPQMRTGFKPYKAHKDTRKVWHNYFPPSGNFKLHKSSGDRFPVDVITFSNGNHHTVHPTQKPVDLLKYLIKTYTNKGMTVLDNCMGSGSTGVAAKELKRDFIGMELDEKYFEIAKKRINEA